MPTHDVIVTGGTSQGAIAAESLARDGLDVGVIEPSPHRGGETTGGLGIGDWPGSPSGVGGIAKELALAISNESLASGWVPPGSGWTWPRNFEAAAAQRALDTVCPTSNPKVTYYFNSYIQSVSAQQLSDRRRITGVVLQSVQRDPLTKKWIGTTRNAQTLVARKGIIECEWLGDAMRLAGVPRGFGREPARRHNEPIGLAGFNFASRVAKTYRSVDSRGNIAPYRSMPPYSPDGVIDERMQGRGDLRPMAMGYRLMLSTAPDRVPWDTVKTQAIAAGIFRREDWGAWIEEINREGYGNIDLGGTGITARRSVPSAQGSPDPGLPLLSTNGMDVIDGSAWEYMIASYQRREQIAWDVMVSMLCRLIIAATDASVPQALKDNMALYGLCPNQFQTDYIGVPGWSPWLYVREWPRLITDTMIDANYSLNNAPCDDPIVRNYYYHDSHSSEEYPLPDLTSVREGRPAEEFEYSTPWSQSFRSIKPNRRIAANMYCPIAPAITHASQMSQRIAWNMMMAAEAAAKAMKIAADRGIDPCDVPYDELVKRLLAAGIPIK